MFFLLRLVFWIALVCLLLPSSQEDNRHLLTSAEQTMNDMRGFCQRNPQVCDDARVTMTALLAKLRSGAELLQTWLAEHAKDREGHAAAAPEPTAATGAGKGGRSDLATAPQPVAKWQDSLNITDRQMPWHGPAGF